MQSIHTVNYCSVIERNQLLMYAAPWMTLRIVMLSVRTQTQETTWYKISFSCNSGNTNYPIVIESRSVIPEAEGGASHTPRSQEPEAAASKAFIRSCPQGQPLQEHPRPRTQTGHPEQAPWPLPSPSEAGPGCTQLPEGVGFLPQTQGTAGQGLGHKRKAEPLKAPCVNPKPFRSP